MIQTDTSGNIVKVIITGMQYTDGLMEQYITESTKSASKMVKDIRGGQMAMNIGESSRITSNGEKESNKKMENSTKTLMKKESASKGVNFQS